MLTVRTNLNNLALEGKIGIATTALGCGTAAVGQGINVLNDLVVSGKHVLYLSDEAASHVTEAGIGAIGVGTLMLAVGWYRSGRRTT